MLSSRKMSKLPHLDQPGGDAGQVRDRLLEPLGVLGEVGVDAGHETDHRRPT